MATAARWRGDRRQVFARGRKGQGADQVRRFAIWAAWYLVGNADGHAKNVSLLHTAAATSLSPAYDVLCTAAYERHDERLAMWMGHEYRPARVERRHWERFVDGVGFSRSFLRRIRELAEQAPAAVRVASDDLVARGWHDPLLAQVVEIVDARSRCVVDALSA